MFALTMKWLEGRVSAIKGMVMPYGKKDGYVQGLWNKRVQARDSATAKGHLLGRSAEGWRKRYLYI